MHLFVIVNGQNYLLFKSFKISPCFCHGTGLLERTRGLPGIPSIVHFQTLRFSPPPSPCLVCKVSVFTHRFVTLLAKRRRDHEAKKAVAAVAEGEGQQNTSSTTPSDVDTAGAYVQRLSHSCNVMGYGLSINTCSR